MTAREIPLLRESAAFSARLLEAARRFGDSHYRWQRRVNWSHRYEQDFYAAEARVFERDATAYLSRTANESELQDIWQRRLSGRRAAVALARVLAHWLFTLVGPLLALSWRLRTQGATTYRKCYVDDIELVFDPKAAGVMRVVYPFPLNARRQWRYLGWLRDQGHPFRLGGLPYGLRDTWRFIRQRDVRALMRLEARAQIRHARALVREGFVRFELSDEFDIGSLDFARCLARQRADVVNSAHGVGKYLPVHAYGEFHVLTQRQIEYYHAVRACCYTIRRLNDTCPLPMQYPPLAGSDVHPTAGPDVRLVLLGQTFAGASELIAQNETAVAAHLHAELGGRSDIDLYYKPHPNRHSIDSPQGFRALAAMSLVNGRPGTVFASFFSTCQIDPSFKGHKVLLRGHLIHPEISFDEDEPILEVHELVALLVGMAQGAKTVTRDSVTQAPLQPQVALHGESP